MRNFTLSVLMAVLCTFANASPAEKQIKAIRITSIPKIDGVLDDECWKNLPVATDFITNDPTFGLPASQNTIVKICYDNAALYIAAYMYDTHPEKINTQLTQRDGSGNVDNLAIGLDTYNDNQNAFRFTVSAAGVQSDGKMSPNNYDLNFDAVWQSVTSEVKDGWVAEIRIPYSAIRFPSLPVQDWGIQFARNIVSTGEYDTWSPVDPQKSSALAQWGTLVGIENIKPPLRLSFTPYISASVQSDPVSVDPVDYSVSKSFSAGMDLKYGINESFTLDMTLVPDFGQVQSDNVVLNLSPFETKYDEKRQFFTEGTELFNPSNNLIQEGKLFYSRRIGGTPSGYYDVENQLSTNEIIEKNPSATQLYNATKISGRTNKGLGIGYLNAITAPMYATIKNTETGETRRYQTDVLTNYNMLVFDQTLKNNSRVSLYNTNVLRDGSATDANVTSVSFDLHNKKDSYSASGYANLSSIHNSSFEKNPDNGFYYGVTLSKIAGIVQFDLAHSIVDKNYNQNDFGIMYYNNEISNFAGIRLQNSKPKVNLLNWSAWLGANYKMRYQPSSYQEFNFNCGFNSTFKNFWSGGVFFTSNPVEYIDYYEPRVEGRQYNRHGYGYGNIYVNTDYRKKFIMNASVGYGESPVPTDPYYEFSLDPSWKATDKIQLGYGVFCSKDNRNFGFSHFDSIGQSIIGRRDVNTVSQTLVVKYIFNPHMNVSVRGRYYWSKVVYDEFYNLLDDGSTTNIGYQSGYDENFNQFNLDLIYTWEFAPGSNLTFSWKNIFYQGDDKGSDSYATNCKKTFEQPSSNNFSLKLMYYLDYNKLRRNKV